MQKRPLGITILVVFNILVTVVSLLIQPNFGVLFLFSSGIGMWIGKSWGWWLGMVFYHYLIIIGIVPAVVTALISPISGMQYSYYGLRIAIGALVLFYLFSDNVTEYFGISSISKLKLWKYSSDN